MDLLTHMHQALLNLLNAKLRSFLAVLGILVGTGSVVALIMSSSLATAHALAQFKRLGTNLIAANIQSTESLSSGESLTLQDIPALYAASPKQITLIAPYISMGKNIYIAGLTASSTVIATIGNFAKIAKLQLEQGRMISWADNKQMVCDIGTNLARKIRSRGVNPIGSELLVGKSMYQVVGVLKHWQSNFILYMDVDNAVIVPIETASNLSNAQISDVVFRLIKKPNIKLVKTQLKTKFFQLFPHKRVYMRDPANIINIVHKQQATLSLLQAAIASISLLVGGIGVMNIMLVSVVERRRSIGVRMAIGARRSDILKMFLIESVFLTLFGGALGVFFGFVVSYSWAYFNSWGFEMYWLPVILGFGVSVLVGILSGWYPALRASRLNPIQILSQ